MHDTVRYKCIVVSNGTKQMEAPERAPQGCITVTELGLGELGGNRGKLCRAHPAC